jgi:TrmH family RNA methyltransferase
MFELKDIIKEKNVVFLEDINDPGNLGAIIRNCVAFDIKALITSKNSVDIYNPKVLRSTAGNIFKIKILNKVEKIETIKKLKENNFYVYITSLSSNNYINKIIFKTKNVFVFGNESCGVSNKIKDLMDESIKIKIKNVESLNLAVSNGIILNQIFNN